jgi:hypothetical protein
LPRSLGSKIDRAAKAHPIGADAWHAREFDATRALAARRRQNLVEQNRTSKDDPASCELTWSSGHASFVPFSHHAARRCRVRCQRSVGRMELAKSPPLIAATGSARSTVEVR